jgi:hypothetical protein
LEAAPLPSGSTPNGHPEIWGCEKIASAFKLFEAAASSDHIDTNGLDSKTVAKILLDKVRCIGSLLEVDEPSQSTDFNDLVFGTSATPVPTQKELIYWYGHRDFTDSVLSYVYGYWYYDGRHRGCRIVLIWKPGSRR